MFSIFYDEYGFQILLCIAIASLVLIFIYNWLYGNRGSFVDYYDYMVSLFNKSTTKQTLSNNASSSSSSSSSNRRIVTYDYDDDDDDGCSTNNGNSGNSMSRGESECKRAIERLTAKSFDKMRPEFLRNVITNSNLELDCYNDELRLAVEYNGEQHYKYVPYFHKTKDAFYNLKYRDDMKRRLCAENGVRLITVPYSVPIYDIERYIQNSLNTVPR